MDFRVFAFLIDNSPLTKETAESLKSMENIGIPVDLVLERDIQKYVKLSGFPLHKNFENLSQKDKSDYLRAYFMHHFGGGYASIKYYSKSWLNAFKKLKEEEDRYIIGYREFSKDTVAQIGGRGQRELEKHYRLLVGNNSYICKPQTDFTSAWLNKVETILDKRDFSGEYPLKDNELFENIFHPLCLNYFQHILFDESVKPDSK